jgi:hypothetical protein
MGHLVNAISTRVGWFVTWKDEIYLDFSHQSDYIHHFIRIRMALIYILFSREPWDEYCFISSHFNMLKKRRTICVMIYVYMGKIMLYYQGYQDMFVYYGRRLMNRNFISHQIKGNMLFNLLVMRGLMVIMEPFDLIYPEFKFNSSAKLKKKKDDKDKMTKFFSLNQFLINRIYGVRNFHAIMWLHQIRYSRIRNKAPLLRSLAMRFHLTQAASIWTSFRLLSEVLFIWHVYLPFYSFMCEYLEYLISQIYLSDTSKVCVSFELFLNDHVTPTFVTRYMLRKLAQNFTWRYVIDTMLKELKFVMHKNLSNPVKKSLVQLSKTYDFLILFFIRYSKLFINTYLLAFRSKYLIDFNIINIIYSVEFAYILINNNILNFLNILSLIIPKFNKIPTNIILQRINSDIYNILLDMYYKIQYNSNLLTSTREMIYKYFVTKIRFIRYNQKKVIFLYQNSESNNRYKKNYNIKFMEGFKSRMGGRLSRKQRASSFLLTWGTVPLNTFSSNIEYAFFSAPLRNSEVTIKLWFNKTTDMPAFHHFQKKNYICEEIDETESFEDEF